MKPALVIGSEGLVGAHLVETLLEDRWFVNGIARKIRSIRTHPRYQHLPCDILESSQFDSIADNLKTIIYIFNCIYIQ